MVDKLNEMIEHCKLQQEKMDATDALVVFKVPRPARGNSIKLIKNRGPAGEVLEATADYTIGGWKADAVIRFLERERARELSIMLDVAKKALQFNGAN